MPRGFKRKRGDTWEIRVYAGRDDLTGAEKRLYRTVRGSEDDADRELRKLLDQVDEGMIAGPDTPFGTLLDRWQASKARSWSPKTAMETAGYIRRHLQPLRPKPLRKITPAALDAFYVDLGSKLAPSSVQRIHGIIHAALEQAVRWDWIARNPASRCEHSCRSDTKESKEPLDSPAQGV